MNNDTNPTQTAIWSPLGALFGLPLLGILSQTDPQTGAATTETAAPDFIPSFGGATAGVDMGQYAMVCVGLVVAILVLAWGFRRVLAGNLRSRANRRSMKVVDMLPLGGKRHLAVVRCYDRTLVLGLGENEVNLVLELDADQDVEGSLAKLIPAQAAPQNTEEGAAVIPAAPASPKVGLFSSILASARTGLEKKGVRGSGEARVRSAAQAAAQAAAPAAVTEFTSLEAQAATAAAVPPMAVKPIPVAAPKGEKAPTSTGGGWVG